MSTNPTLLQHARALVRASVDSFEDIVESVAEWLEDDASPLPEGLSAYEAAEKIVEPIVTEQCDRESSWGDAPTDVDRLLDAFEDLEAKLIACFEDHGADTRDGHDLAMDVIPDERDPLTTRGYVFYTGQDLQSAVEDGVLFLGFGPWGFTPPEDVRATLVETLQHHGLDVVNASSNNERVEVSLTWHRRGWLGGALGPHPAPPALDGALEAQAVEVPASVSHGSPTNSLFNNPPWIPAAHVANTPMTAGKATVLVRSGSKAGAIAVVGRLFALNPVAGGRLAVVLVEKKRARLLARRGRAWMVEVLDEAPTSADTETMAEALVARATSFAAQPDVPYGITRLPLYLQDQPPGRIADICADALITDDAVMEEVRAELDVGRRLRLVLDRI